MYIESLENVFFFRHISQLESQANSNTQQINDLKERLAIELSRNHHAVRSAHSISGIIAVCIMYSHSLISYLLWPQVLIFLIFTIFS